jgi:GGDEF domain-containing protein
MLAALRPALTPAAILAVAAIAVAVEPQLPPSLVGLRTIGPYLVLILAAAMCLWFNRGRAFIALVSFLAAYAGYRFALDFGEASFAARAVYASLALLVPLNVLLALLAPERGVFHHHDYRWALLGIAECVLIGWIASSGLSALSGVAWQSMFDHWLLRSPPTPWAGRILFAAAFVAAAWRAWPRYSPLEVGMAGALAAFFIACEWAAQHGVFGIFVSAAGLILLVAMLEESYRLAFQDELTGLPGRRALQEALAGLGPQYTVAMVDVDHFKKFNDTHGHDIGDQVLKLVAARLDRIEGGGRAFRYGGEEFTVLFPGRPLKEALPHLERMRRSIEGYRMAVRASDRPRDKEEGEKRRADSAPAHTLSVTVSIGAAEPRARVQTPAKVVKAADEALYRAKKAGRNRLSR